MAEVSVIVPVYEAEKFLEACIGSVISQEFQDWELLLVDDGSTDASNAICRRCASADPRIRLIEQANRGVSEARNRGLDQASARYVTFLDADDELLPGALSALYDIATERNADVVMGRIVEGEEKPDGPTGKFHERSVKPRMFCRDMLYRKRYADSSMCARLFPKSLFEGTRFYMGKYEDLEILPRLLNHARKMIVTDRPVYFYRDNPSSFINTWSESHRDSVKVTRRIMAGCEGDEELGRAARNRHFRANYNLLFGLMRHRPDDRDGIAECYEEIRRLRGDVMADSSSLLSTRLGALLSYIGLKCIKRIVRCRAGLKE